MKFAGCLEVLAAALRCLLACVCLQPLHCSCQPVAAAAVGPPALSWHSCAARQPRIAARRPRAPAPQTDGMVGRKALALPPSSMHEGVELENVVLGDGSGGWRLPALLMYLLLCCCYAAADVVLLPFGTAWLQPMRAAHWQAIVCQQQPEVCPLAHPCPLFRLPAPLPAVLVGCKISNSVLGKGAYVGRGTRVESSLLLGNAAWMSDSNRREALERGEPVFGVGEFGQCGAVGPVGAVGSWNWSAGC